jgi:hypothetical protein
MPLPNLFIIGASKSATTSLHRYLSTHSEILMSQPKEPHFFVEEVHWSRGWNWYMSLFANGKQVKILGEASGYYTWYPIYKGVPQRIASHIPAPKFIYILREPIQRAVSHYWYYVHLLRESRPMLEAFHASPEYVEVGRYAMQLEQYLEFFRLDQFFLTTSERLRKAPNEVLREIYQFLGVGERNPGEDVEQIHHETPKEIMIPRWPVLHQIRYSKLWTRVQGFCPGSVRRLATRLAYGKIRKTENAPPEVLDYLIPLYEKENERLFQLIGRRFEEWRSYERAQRGCSDHSRR